MFATNSGKRLFRIAPEIGACGIQSAPRSACYETLALNAMTGAHRAHNCCYEPCGFNAGKAMLQRFNFAVFSKGPPATNRESPRGEGRGTRGFCLPLSGLFLWTTPARCRFLLGAALSENIPLSNPGRGKEKVRFLRSGSLGPWQPAAKDERADFALGPESLPGEK
jgi:hypothetical protein